MLGWGWVYGQYEKLLDIDFIILFFFQCKDTRLDERGIGLSF